MSEPFWLELMLHIPKFDLRAPAVPVLLAAAVALGASNACATLGQQAGSTPATSAAASLRPAARLLAVRPGARSEPFVVYEDQLENGTAVRQYAGPDGVVFAVSWRGPVLPDLNALLGVYFPVFRRETERLRAGGRRGSPLSVMRDGLVVESNGRMRNFFGYAYASDLMPAGVAVQDVQP